MPLSVLTENDFTARTHDEAVRRLRGKVPLTSDEFDALSAAQKRRAFRIAGVNNARLIQDVRDRLVRAVREGRSFRDFRNEVMELFERGEIPQPALHRLQLVFRQNTLQAYSDSRKEMLNDPDIVKAFPYRRYLTVGNGTPGFKNVRRDHAVLHGLVFRWDDPFWDRHTPPWDYNCRCTYVPLSEREVKRRRIKVRNAGYVRRRLKVKPHPGFGTGGEFELGSLDRELREALKEVLGEG